MADVRRLRIVVIGAGMGGLTTALAFARKGFKRIDVYENASDLGFVGAGIQLPPNMQCVLHQLGCWDEIAKGSIDVEATSIRQGGTNIELGRVNTTDVRDKYGYPHCVGHRSSLANGLANACKRESAITLHFAHQVMSVDAFEPKPRLTVKPRDGEPMQVEVDILVAADGVKSVTRNQMLAVLGAEPEETDTGQAAYRIMLRREQMEHDPEMLALLDSATVVRWIGPQRHVIAYALSSHTIYNLSTTQPDTRFASATNATYTTRGSKQAMLDVFHDFCPLVQRMLALVPEGDVCEWKLRVHRPLRTWVHGAVALVGDACHPTLPHLGQGAAMAIEDGAVLAECVSHAPALDPATLSRCLKTYELIRKEHTTAVVDMAAHSARTLHMDEGDAMEERDRQFRESAKTGSVPDKWADPEVQKKIYSHDWIREAQESFEAFYARLES